MRGSGRVVPSSGDRCQASISGAVRSFTFGACRVLMLMDSQFAAPW